MEEEIATNSLTVPQLERSIPEIVNLLSALDTPINVEYGYACNLPIDELWQTMQMDLPHLQDFINKSREDRIFELGVSDLHVNDLEGRWSIKLCHESDLHFVSANRQLLEDVATMWDRNGFTVMISPYTTIQTPREWRTMAFPIGSPDALMS